jgi:hypothetical protein
LKYTKIKADVSSNLKPDSKVDFRNLRLGLGGHMLTPFKNLKLTSNLNIQCKLDFRNVGVSLEIQV